MEIVLKTIETKIYKFFLKNFIIYIVDNQNLNLLPKTRMVATILISYVDKNKISYVTFKYSNCDVIWRGRQYRVNKKILVACLCIILMLITPFTVIARGNKVTSNLIEESDVEGLVAQLRVVINEILQEYGYIPMIRTICNKIVDVLDSFGLILYCIFLIVLMIPVAIIFLILYFLGLRGTYIFLYVGSIILALSVEFDFNCHKLVSSNLFLKSLSNIFSIDTSDSSILTGLDECPCMQQ